MSLIISIHTGEGIVMASDSRTTYNSQETSTLPDGKGTVIIKHQGIHHSDTTYKTFLAGKNIGISTCGDASIDEKPLAGFIESFIHEKICDDTDICDVPNLLLDYFSCFSPIPHIIFHVSGYSTKDGIMTQKLYRVFVATKEIIPVNTSLQGVIWNGEFEILSRLINTVWYKRKEKDNETGIETDKYEEQKAPPIPWNYFSLQDAIDFAIYAINTTIETMRFQQRLKTVGGPIDILIIKPNESF